MGRDLFYSPSTFSKPKKFFFHVTKHIYLSEYSRISSRYYAHTMAEHGWVTGFYLNLQVEMTRWTFDSTSSKEDRLFSNLQFLEVEDGIGWWLFTRGASFGWCAAAKKVGKVRNRSRSLWRSNESTESRPSFFFFINSFQGKWKSCVTTLAPGHFLRPSSLV